MDIVGPVWQGWTLRDWTMMDGVAMVDIAAAAAAAAEVGADDAVDRNATQQFFCVSS